MNLYELNEAIYGCIDEETGEVDAEKLDSLMMERNTKIENIALWIKQLRAEADMLKAEKQTLEARQRAKNAKADSLEKYLATALDGQKFETTKASITFRTSKIVKITDYMKIPDDYLKYSEPTADKNAIKAALKDGIKIDGAELVDSVSMKVR